MNLYISDLHLGHNNVIRFDHRPFADVEDKKSCIECRRLHQQLHTGRCE